MPPDISEVIDLCSDEEDDPAPARRALSTQQGGNSTRSEDLPAPLNGHTHSRDFSAPSSSTSRPRPSPSNINGSAAAAKKLQPSSVARLERPRPGSSAQADDAFKRTSSDQDRTQMPRNGALHAPSIGNTRKNATAANKSQSSRSGSRLLESPPRSRAAARPGHQSISASPNPSSSSRSQKRPREDHESMSVSAKKPRLENEDPKTGMEMQSSFAQRTERTTWPITTSSTSTLPAKGSKVIDLTTPEPENRERRGQNYKSPRTVPTIETRHKLGSGRAHKSGTPGSPGNGKGAVGSGSANSADRVQILPSRETTVEKTSETARVTRPKSSAVSKSPALVRATVDPGRSRKGSERRPTSEIPESPPVSPVGSLSSPGKVGTNRNNSPDRSSEQRVAEAASVKDHGDARKEVPPNKNTTTIPSPQHVASNGRRGQGPGKLPEQEASSDQDSSVIIASMSSALKSVMPDVAGIPTSRQVELVVGQHLEEMRRDNEHWTRIELRRARHSTGSSPLSGKGVKPTSVFKSLRPIELDVATEKRAVQPNIVKICVEQFLNAPRKTSKTLYALTCTMFRTEAADVPAYSHYVSIKNSFLAPNETRMQHNPYLGDDFDIEHSGVYDRYYNDTNNRERKLLRLGQAESFAAYAQDMLTQAGCDWADLLQFFLDPSPDVGASPDARKALQTRETYCKEDFLRDGARWKSILSKLPTPKPDSVGKAALLCDQFHLLAKFPLWHVVRRDDFTRRLVREIETCSIEGDLTCRVCMRLACPYHGEMKEALKGDEEDDQLSQYERCVLETDIIDHKQVNFRIRVSLPQTVEDDISSAAAPPDRRHLDYWTKGKMSSLKLPWNPPDREPFYPCHHPGQSCENARCTCFVEKILCEKSCACPSTCPRKFQGCSCSLAKSRKGRKLCFEDSRCVCFAMKRECDPDLCGACGVSDVLAPLHKHREHPDRCRNAGTQRGVGKHLIIGDSGIHGLGLYTCEEILPHDFVGEYKGEIIGKEEADRRSDVYVHQNLSYLFNLNKAQDIDSLYFGNKIRFINHASDEKCNLYARLATVNTVNRIALYGRRKIKPGQELFFCYGDQFPTKDFGDTAEKDTAEKKAVPKARNSGFLSEFFDMEEVEDDWGNLRARKVASSVSKNDGARTTARGRARQFAKKSVDDERRGRTHDDSNSPQLGDEQDEDADEMTNAGAPEWEDAETRLYGYNISDGVDGDTVIEPGDETFQPSDSGSEAQFDDNSSTSEE